MIKKIICTHISVSTYTCVHIDTWLGASKWGGMLTINLDRGYSVLCTVLFLEPFFMFDIISKWKGFSQVNFTRKIGICMFNSHSVQFSSVAQSYLTLFDPMNCSMPGFPVHHQLLESTQTQVHRVGDVDPFYSCPQSLPASGSFPMSQLFAWGGQNIGVSASASGLPMNTQDWSPLGWTDWIYLQSKGLSRVFSKTTVQKHQFFNTQLSLQSNSHIYTWPLEKP